MASLSNTKIKDTYQSLVKFNDNGNITTSPKRLTDGFGNVSPFYVSTTQIGIGTSPNSSYDLHVYGNTKIGANLDVSGNLTVGGTLTYLNVTDLEVDDPLIQLAVNNTANILDIGLFGKYAVSTNVKYKGFFNDASDNKFKLFTGLTEKPLTTVNTSDSGYTVATLVANLEGNVTGNLTGNAATSTKISSITNSNIVQLTTEQTLTNKTLTSPTITGTGSIAGAFTGNITGNVLTTAADDTVSTVLNSNVGSDDAATFTGDVTGTVSSLSNHDTDDLSEGTTNLYFTTTRARASFTEGTGVTITDGEISIGQAVNTDSDVTFGDIDGSAISGTTGTFSGDLSANNLSGTNTGDQTLPTDFVSKANGGTFGDLVSGIAPTADLNFATKKYVDDNSGSSQTLAQTLALGNTSGSNDLIIQDNDELVLGSSTDFRAYHNETNTLFRINTGDLIFNSFVDDGDIKFQLDNGADPAVPTEYMRLDGGEVKTIFSKSTRYNDNVKALFGSGSDLELFFSNADGYLRNNTGDLYIQNLANDKSIVFQSDNGIGGVTEYFKIDGNINRNVILVTTQLNDNVPMIFGAGAGRPSIKYDSTASQLFINGSTNLLSAVNFAGLISSTYSGTGTHVLQNATSNGTVLRLDCTGDSSSLYLQGDHIYASGTLVIGNASSGANLYRATTHNVESGNVRILTADGSEGGGLQIYSTTQHQYPQIYSDSTREAMWNYKNDTATWYVGIRNSLQLVGAKSAFAFYNTTDGASVGGYSTAGDHYAKNSSRSKIFYDLDDVNFFYDPASGSQQQYTLNVSGTTGNYGSQIIAGQTSINLPYTLQDSNKRPILAATGQYPVLHLNHTINTNTNHGPTIQFTHNGVTDDRQWVIGSTGDGISLDIGFSSDDYYSGGNNYNPHRGISGYIGKTYMRFRENGRIGIGSGGDWGSFGGGEPSYDIDTRGTLYNNTDVRAPIFYDSDDINYYLNLASTSNLNSATFAGAVRAGSATINTTYGPAILNSSTSAGWGSGNLPYLGSNNSSSTVSSIFIHNIHATFRTDNNRTGATGRAGVRMAIDANGTNWWDCGLIGDEFEIYRNSSTQRMLVIDSSGNVTGLTSLRSPIFYDTDDTTYFVNPAANGSRIKNLVIVPQSESWSEGIRFDMPSQGAWGGLRWSRAGASSNSANWALGFAGNEYTDDMLWWSGTGNHRWRLNHSGDVTVQGSSRAPIFYDSNDTTYYTNPAGNSVLTTATFNLNANSTISLNAAGTNASQIKAGAGDELYLGGNNTWQMRLSGGNILMDNGGYALSSGSFRAPIFYDSANTAYYLDPASTSTSLRIAGGISTNVANGNVIIKHTVSEANSWLFQENAANWGLFWLNEGANGTAFGSYTTVGAEFIGFRNGSQTGFKNPSAWTGINSAAYAGWLLSNYSGYFWTASTQYSETDMRAPIFYDANDTGYFVNPASKSEIYDLKLKGANHKYLEIDPTGNYESMVRYMGASGSDWYVGKRTSTNSSSNSGISTSDYHFYSAAAGKTVGGVTSNGGIHAQYFGFTVGDPAATYTYNDSSTRSKVYVSSRYPVITINVNNNGNAAHGGTLQFVANGYDSNAQWVIGSGGTCQFLDFGFGQPSNKNPHVGISGYQGKTMMRMIKSGKVGIGGNWGPNGSGDPSYDLDVLGTIRASSDVIAFSDKRVKENIKTINNALEKVTKLRGVTYTRKDIEDKSTKVGVIAQEVLEVLPEVVNQDDKGMYSVAYGNIVGVLIEAVKEQQKQINELTNIIDKLNK